MPALNYDYDYYEYARTRRSTSTVKSGRSTTSRANKKIVNNDVLTTRKKSSAYVKEKQVPNRNSNARKVARESTNTQKVVKKRNSKGITEDINIKSRATRNIAKPKEMTLKRPKAYAKKKSFLTLKNIAVLGVTFAVFFMICYRYSLINERFVEIKNMKNELSEIQTVNEQIQADIENKTDLKYVENYAKYQLGMQKPSNSQIKYISSEKEDKIITPVCVDSEEENLFIKILKEVRKIID